MAEDYTAITTLSPGELTPDLTLQNDCLYILHRHYPNWGWEVEVLQGLVVVRNRDLTHSKPWGFCMKRDMMDVDLKCVMRAGGELLERYNKWRVGFDPDDYLQNFRKMPFIQPEQ